MAKGFTYEKVTELQTQRKVQKAFKVLGLDWSLHKMTTKDTVTQRYKEILQQHHADVGGDGAVDLDAVRKAKDGIMNFVEKRDG